MWRNRSRRTSRAGLSSRNPSYTTWRNSLSSVQIRNLTSATSSGRTQCIRLRTKGDPKRLPRGGGTSSGILSVASGCRRRHNRSSSAVLMPVPARPVWSPRASTARCGPGNTRAITRRSASNLAMLRPAHGSGRGARVRIGQADAALIGIPTAVRPGKSPISNRFCRALAATPSSSQRSMSAAASAARCASIAGSSTPAR